MKYCLLVLVQLVVYQKSVWATGNKFIHPGMLHTDADFHVARQLVIEKKSPAIDSWKLLQESVFSNPAYQPSPVNIVVRGKPTWGVDNYHKLYRDAAAAYQLALRWKITGETAFGDAAIRILDAWAKTLGIIAGTSGRYLAAGLYGYQLANAAEIMRGYAQWTGLSDFQTFMLKVFYRSNKEFLTNHVNHGPAGLHYWANWDLCNLASMMAIGILTDRPDIYDEAKNYLLSGPGNGNLNRAIWKVYPDNLAQVQESGRDQGHTTLDIALIGVLCQMAWNQGDDIYKFNDNIFLKGAEYAAKYNLGENVPWTDYQDDDGNHHINVSSIGRGIIRPIWTMIFNHYTRIKKMDAPYTQKMMDHVGPEGGGGNYGTTSGGFDQLGFGSLLFNN